MNSVQFLKRFHPDRYWVLTAIASDRKGIETRPFSPDEAVAAEQWIKERNGQRNLYFSVGEVISAEEKKAGRENIAAVHWLHVDIDAGPGDLLAELERIKLLVTKKLPTGVPKPTCVIYSGGGYQCFWRLAEPIPVQGNSEAASHAARYNKQLELIFGGDQCHNVDRIMRLPGTLNIPNAQKVAKGRVPVESAVLYFDKSSYQISEFDLAADVAVSPGATVEISGNIPRLNSVDDLDEWDVPDRIKVIVVQGFHPDEVKDGDESRSAWLFDAVCNMMRAGCPDEIIYSVITDPNFKIADSVREASDPHKYALKQLRSAKEAVESENLYLLNEKHAVISNIGGKCRVIEEVWDEVMKRHRLVKQTFEDFRNRYMNQYEMVNDGEKIKQVPIGKWWLMHPRRRQYDRLVFAPGHEIPDAYNLWRGFGCNAIPGTKHQSLLDHMLDTICMGDHEHYEFLLGWLASAVQKPDDPGAVAVVLRGKPGTGKSFLAKRIGHLFGRHFLHISNASHLTGNFNSHLRDAIFVLADEAFYAGDKRHESVLKTLITEETLMIEAKGVDAEASANFTHLMIASNSDWVVPVGAQDRRFFVLDVSDEFMRNNTHFGDIQDILEDGGYEHLLHFLMNYDLSNFNSQDVPQTSALHDQKTMTLALHEEWWLNILIEGGMMGGDWGMNGVQYLNEQMWASYEATVNGAPAFSRISRMKLVRYIKGICPESRQCRMRQDARILRGQQFPPLDVARHNWNEFHRANQTWDNPMEGEGGEDLPF